MKWDVFSKGKLEVFVVAHFLDHTKKEKKSRFERTGSFFLNAVRKAFLSKDKVTFGQPLKMDRKETRKNN